MKCVEVEKQLDFLMDGEINPSVEENIREHLKECFLCAENLERLQEVSGLLRQSLPVSPPVQLSKRVMKEFARVQSEKYQPGKANNGWKAFFGQFAFPRLATAMVAALFIVSIFAAFQIGRITALSSPASPSGEIAARETIAQENSNESKLTAQTVIVEKPVTKTIKIPVVKEKVVTRIVYLQEPKRNSKQNQIRYAPAVSSDYALKTSVRNNEFMTRIDLTNFRPVTDTKARIIKKGENDEN